jgi:hypothetical protein
MLPAPHNSFLETTATPATSRLGGRRHLTMLDDNPSGLMACNPKRIFGPVSSFLASRIGARWQHVVTELCDRLGSESNYRRILPKLTELVEFQVVLENGQLYHGSGLLQGQPLQAGWRRRLYVCPITGRLKRIESAIRVREKCAM